VWRPAKKKRPYKQYSIVSKLRSEGKSNYHFETMLNCLTFEEMIALRLQLLFNGMNGKLYGIPLFKIMNKMVHDAVIKFLISASNSMSEAGFIVGISRKNLFNIIRKAEVIDYYNDVSCKKGWPKNDLMRPTRKD